jgi:hypothetical protein
MPVNWSSNNASALPCRGYSVECVSDDGRSKLCTLQCPLHVLNGLNAFHALLTLLHTRGTQVEELICVGTDFTAKKEHEYARSSFLASLSHEIRYRPTAVLCLYVCASLLCCVPM